MNTKTKNRPSFNRVILLVLDGVGAGALPDAPDFGDATTVNTLGNIGRYLKEKLNRQLKLPHLRSMGLGQVTSIEGVSNIQGPIGRGVFGRAKEKSKAKDTTSGHWEMAGITVSKPFPVFPNGFPKAWVDQWIQDCNLPGVLGNHPASGTTIIEQLGQEHLETGKPILYTSGDSVWQIAAHEEAFGLERLYEISLQARDLCDAHNIARVIARPFIGDPKNGVEFERTYNRKDYSIAPPKPSVLVKLQEREIPVVSVGKVGSIYADQGFEEFYPTKGNADGVHTLLQLLTKQRSSLIFCNLIDFDMLYGHRRNPKGFADALEDFDRALPFLLRTLSPYDLLLIAADHGNDPTAPGTDHTREHIPILGFHRQLPDRWIDLGVRESFADIGATIFEALTNEEYSTACPDLDGTSFLDLVRPGSFES